MPSIGKSAQLCPLGSLGIAKPCQPCVGSDVLETATRMSFGLNALSEEVANQRWLTGSYNTRGSTGSPAGVTPAACQKSDRLNVWMSAPDLSYTLYTLFRSSTNEFGPTAP